MRSYVQPDATESGSPQMASNSVYGIISGTSYEYQRLQSHFYHNELFPDGVNIEGAFIIVKEPN